MEKIHGPATATTRSCPAGAMYDLKKKQRPVPMKISDWLDEKAAQALRVFLCEKSPLFQGGKVWVLVFL